MNKNLSVKDIEGSWIGPTSTGLLERCKRYWETPLRELSDIMVVTYLNQNIASSYMVLEAERRLRDEERDDSELYDGQLVEVLERVKST